MSQNTIVPTRQTPASAPSVTLTTVPTPYLLVPAIVYVSLAFAIYIVVRGDIAQIALMLSYLAAVLRMRLHRDT